MNNYKINCYKNNNSSKFKYKKKVRLIKKINKNSSNKKNYCKKMTNFNSNHNSTSNNNNRLSKFLLAIFKFRKLNLYKN